MSDSAPFTTFVSEHPVILAPLAGVSDAVMRRLCIEQGAQFTFTEMVSAKGLSYSSTKTESLLERAPNEHGVGVQLFGHEPQTMAREAVWVQEHLQDALVCIDVNMGCPARKVVTKGDGSALMSDPALAISIIESMTQAVDVPVTVKMRRGFDIDDESCVELACGVEQAGAAAVTVHGRYAKQMYRGASCWEAIARVKDAVSIPVIGNGDVVDGASACALREQTGCDGVMIGRAAQGNPWVFGSVKAAWFGEEPPATVSPHDRLALAWRHAQLLDARNDGNLVRMRKHAMWYIKGLPGASLAREQITHCCVLQDYRDVFDALIEHWNQVEFDAR